MKKTSLEFVKEQLLELDPSLKGAEEGESFKTALVLRHSCQPCQGIIRRP